jgi:photosystem II stability/assembly factor-like uncharacterized protein
MPSGFNPAQQLICHSRPDPSAGRPRTNCPWRARRTEPKLHVMSERIYAATGEDVVRVTLTESTLDSVKAVLTNVGAQCVAVDPRDPDRVYVGSFDRGLFTSDDGGESWRAPDDGPEEQRVLSLSTSLAHVESGRSVVYAGTEPSNLYRSEDGGRSWQRLPALRDLPSEPRWSFPPRPWTHHVKTIALHPTDPDQLLVGIELGGVMRSRDGGASWIDHNPQAHSDAHQLATHPLAPNRVYEAAGQGIASSEDRGDSWHRHEQGLDRHYAWAVAVDGDDPDLWYVSVSRSPFAAHGSGDGEARLLRRDASRDGNSNDAGWSAIDGWGDDPLLRRMPYALAALPEAHGRLLVGLRGGTLLLTNDAGESWSRLTDHRPLTDVVDLVATPA